MDKSNTDLDFSFIDNVTDFLKNDAPSERSLKQSHSQKEAWLGYSAEGKQQRTDKIRKLNLEKWSNKGTYILRSPGADLLDFYDECWQEYIDNLGKDGGLSGKNNGRNQIGGVLPSVVYKLRFETEFKPKHFKSKAWELLSDYIDQDSVWKNYHLDVRKNMYSWLTQEQSVSYEFDLLERLYDFMDEHLNMKVHRGEVRPHSDKNYKPHTLWWRKEAAGWSIIYKN